MVKRLLFVSLLSGLVVALWGLPSHFGYDPTCLIFRGSLDVSCWTADFQPMVRIFSTLGQPDWLAAYLAILLPVSIAFTIQKTQNTQNFRDSRMSEKSDRLKIRNADSLAYRVFRVFWKYIPYLLLATLFYLDLLYTGARSGVLAAWLSLIVLLIAYIWVERRKISNLLPLFIVFIIFGIITFFVGQPFSQLNKFTLSGIKTSLSATPSDQKTTNSSTPHAGALGGTDSSKIRLIVWQGAIDAWGHYPIFGTGVETFAFAYYRFRPEAHNLTSEWNFLYNKAHNEFLNYLATTGAVGLGTYLLMIGWFLLRVIPNLFRDLGSSGDKMLKQVQHDKVLILFLLAGYLSIQVTNFFGFSVVITNIYLFMIPAFVFILGGMINLKRQFVLPSAESRIIARISPYQWTFIFFIILASCFLILNLFRFWNADKSYALGSNLNKAGEYQSAYPKLQEAVVKRDDESVFKDEFALNNAVLAAALISQEETKTSTDTAALANQLAQDAITLNDFITLRHPNNIIFWKSRVRIFYALSQVNPGYLPDALEAVKKAQTLAPTDANISYNLGVLYGQNNNVEKGIETLENTIRLKPDYRDAYYALGLFYHDQAVDEKGDVVDRDKLKKAIDQIQYILDNIGKDDKVAKETLEQWKKL